MINHNFNKKKDRNGSAAMPLDVLTENEFSEQDTENFRIS